MTEKLNSIDKIGKTNAFQTPPGYFETISDEIMSRLLERVTEETRELRLWDKVKPWVYMAAMFGGVALMVRMFVGTPDKSSTVDFASEGIQLTSSSEIEEFYHYYEDQAASSVYHETFYLNELPADLK